MVLFFAVIFASLFTMWTPANILSDQPAFWENLTGANADVPVIPTVNPVNQPSRTIGIIVGHWGYDKYGVDDPGAVCTDANGKVTLKEVDVNMRIATFLQQELIQDGFEVDLLEELDPRLKGYHALAVVSVHSDSCGWYGDWATGYQLQAAPNTTHPELTERLASCMRNRYYEGTGLLFLNTTSEHMQQYHAFEKFDPRTPSIIIETGFLLLDQKILVEEPDRIAAAIAAGIRCYAFNETIRTDIESGNEDN